MIFAQVVLYSWPIIVVILFRTCSAPTALLASVIAGYLFLPERIALNLPALPTFDKNSVPILSASLIILVGRSGHSRDVRAGWVPQIFLPKFLILALTVGAFLTVVTNSEPLVYGETVLQGLAPWDAFSTILTIIISLLPFLLGRKLLAHPNQQRLFLISLVIAGCAYSILALYEVRMSPQLNKMVYGFFPHSWLQHIRGTGWRPLVFLNHGLWLAAFFSATILAAFGIVRLSSKARKLLYIYIGFWLLLTLVLSKSLGALAATLLLIPVLAFFGVRKQLLIAAIISGVVLAYPMLRSSNVIPIERIQELAETISVNRAASLNFRLGNENQLLEKALIKPAFGWGGWGRNMVYSELGRDISTFDGYWIISLGKGGWTRYLGEFGLLCLPLILIFYRARRYEIGFETSALTLILAANLIDLVLNATLTPITWMIAGSLWGRLELGRISETKIAPDRTPGKNRRLARTQDQKRMPKTTKTDFNKETRPAHHRYTRQKILIERGKADGSRKPGK